MAYRLDPRAPLTETLRATACEQIDGALTALSKADDLESALHDTRKRMKKLRALLRLVRPGMAKTYRKENTALRDLARDFSDIRDAQVLGQTIDGLAKHADGNAAAEHLAPVRAWAAAGREAALQEAGVRDRIEAAQGSLETMRKRAGKWRIDGEPDAALQGGLKRTYKRARKRWRQAVAAPDPALMHEWRKRVKYHWYHCRLLRCAWPAAMKVRIAALDALSGDLGDDHDLVVLLDTLRHDAPDLPPAALHAVETLAATRSQHLRASALAAAPRLMVERPGALSRRLSAYWALAAT